MCPIHKEMDMNNFSEKLNISQSLTDLILNQPPRALEIIKADIRALEKEIMAMLREVAG